MRERSNLVIALANPQLRRRLVALLQGQGRAVGTPQDLEELARLLAERPENEPQHETVLVLDEAFIYPHVYEECARIKAHSRQPILVVLLVEPRTRTRSDWAGADHILRLPMQADEIADRTVDFLE